MQPYHRCWATVDLDALRQNLAWLRHRVGPDVKIMTVVKADAYGHGLRQIATLLMQSGTDVFGVANLAEAATIRSVGRGWPILMLGACVPAEIETAVRDEVMPTISSPAEAEAFSQAARRFGKVVGAHVKVDTGMGRLGVLPEQAASLVAHCASLPGMRVAGLYTHFAAVEDDRQFSREQRQRFSRLVSSLHRAGFQFDYLHANNSGGLLFEGASVFNTVRPGLLVYGVVPPGKRRLVGPLRQNLRPALSWQCHVGFVKDIPKGTALSYGRTFVAPRRLRVATLTAGYGDGYLRSGSNRAQVLIGGRRCRILGRITMDQMIADVTGVRAVEPGSDVVMIGRQGNERITVNELARWGGTIPWEVFTNITYRVPRVYRGSQAA